MKHALKGTAPDELSRPSVLVVEDSPFFGRLLCKRIKQALGFNTVWKQDLASTEALLDEAHPDFFIGLLDLHLPDAENERIVDAVQGRGIPSVVFTGEDDETLRKRIWAKNVIDCVVKQDMEDVSYIIQKIDRIYRNGSTKILLADDSRISRMQLAALLKAHRFQVLEAEDGQQALNMIMQQPDVCLLITDYQMPEMDGFELITAVRRLHKRDQLAIIGLSAADDASVVAQFIRAGADSFITKPFSVEEFYCRVTQGVELVESIQRSRKAEKALESARERLDELEQTRSTIAENISHEIRTPLNAVAGMVHLLEKTGLDDVQRNYLSKVDEASRLMQGIIEDVLDFSKIETGHLSLNPAAFKVREMLDLVMLQMEAKAGRRQNVLSLEVDPAVPEWVNGDARRLKQVILNLVDNAVKFTEKGRVDIRLSRGAGEAPDGCTALEFSVRDTGIGIQPEHQHRLFDGFFQEDMSSTRKYGGSGLGLAISHRLVEMMGGQLTVRSKPGLGSLFSFSVNLKALENYGVAAVESFHLPLKGLRVLVVEDNEINQQVAESLLVDFGATVKIANNGCEALQVLGVDEEPEADSSLCVDLVLMDLQMPEMDGYEATRRIREAGGVFSQLPIIAVTAHGLPGDDERCRACGMNDYLTKPISPEALRMTIMAWAQLDEPAPPGQPEEPIPVRVVEAAKPALSLPAEVPHLKMADGLRAVGGNATLYRKLLGQFYADFRDAAPALSILLTTGDRAQVQLRAHSIKGVAATLGAEAVRNVAAKLEQAMKAGDAASGRTLIGELGGVLDDVMQSIKDLLANEEDAGEEAVPEEGSEIPVSGDVLALLTDLEEKLANQEYLDDAALADLRTVFSRGGGAHAWQNLEEAVGQYDYEQAQAAAGSLRELYRKKE